MNSQTLRAISNQVYKKFPEVAGAQPQVREQGKSQVLVYSGQASLANGKTLRRTVRVTVNAQGEITKMTTSHG